MFGLGLSELLVAVVIALVLFGGKRWGLAAETVPVEERMGERRG